MVFGRKKKKQESDTFEIDENGKEIKQKEVSQDKPKNKPNENLMPWEIPEEDKEEKIDSNTFIYGLRDILKDICNITPNGTEEKDKIMDLCKSADEWAKEFIKGLGD